MYFESICFQSLQCKIASNVLTLIKGKYLFVLPKWYQTLIIEKHTSHSSYNTFEDVLRKKINDGWNIDKIHVNCLVIFDIFVYFVLIDEMLYASILKY